MNEKYSFCPELGLIEATCLIGIILLNCVCVRNMEINIFIYIYQQRPIGLGLVILVFFLVFPPFFNAVSVVWDDVKIVMKSCWGRVINEIPYQDIIVSYSYEYGIYTHSFGIDFIYNWYILCKNRIDDKYIPQYCHTCVLATLSVMNPFATFNPKGYGEDNDAFLLFLSPISINDPESFIALFGIESYNTAVRLNEVYNSNAVEVWFRSSKYIRILYRQIYRYTKQNMIALGIRKESEYTSIMNSLPECIENNKVEKIYKQDICNNINKKTLDRTFPLYKVIKHKDVIRMIVFMIIESIIILYDYLPLLFDVIFY